MRLCQDRGVPERGILLGSTKQDLYSTNQIGQKTVLIEEIFRV
jgi:hypothetical protein